MGARKLEHESSPRAVSKTPLESFEKVEERTEAVTQVEDHKLAMIQTQRTRGGWKLSARGRVRGCRVRLHHPGTDEQLFSRNSSAYGSSSSTSGINSPHSGGNPSSTPCRLG